MTTIGESDESLPADNYHPMTGRTEKLRFNRLRMFHSAIKNDSCDCDKNGLQIFRSASGSDSFHFVEGKPQTCRGERRKSTASASAPKKAIHQR